MSYKFNVEQKSSEARELLEEKPSWIISNSSLLCLLITSVCCLALSLAKIPRSFTAIVLSIENHELIIQGRFDQETINSIRNLKYIDIRAPKIDFPEYIQGKVIQIIKNQLDQKKFNIQIRLMDKECSAGYNLREGEEIHGVYHHESIARYLIRSISVG